MGLGGVKIYCPNCKALTVCASIRLSQYKKFDEEDEDTKSRRWFLTNHEDIQWYRRCRKCLVCNNTFLTAEVSEDFIFEVQRLRDKFAENESELVKINEKLSNKILELSELRSELILTNAELVKFRIKRNQNFVNDIRKMHIWVNRNEKIPLEIAQQFIIRSAWWLTHSSGTPVRAAKHAERIYLSAVHGWVLDFGSNKFLVGKAIERCRNEINVYLEKANLGHKLQLLNFKHALYQHISGSVANNNGEYTGYYPITNNDLVFGAQAIDVNDAANYLIEAAGIGLLFI